jgi:hypothetical protein
MKEQADSISFQPPFHSMCLEHQAILSYLNSPDLDWIDFNSAQLSLSEMPDMVIIGDKRFKYADTSDGRGYCREQEPV